MDLHIYTDGFIIQNQYGGCSFTVHAGDDNLTGEAKALPYLVYEPVVAELEGMHFALIFAMWFSDRDAVRRLFLFCDCQDAINRFKRYRLGLGGGMEVLGREIMELERQLRVRGVQVVPTRVQGHSDIPGNKMADQLAKRGAVEAQRQ